MISICARYSTTDRGSIYVPSKLCEKWLEKDSLTKLRGWSRNGYTDDEIAKEIGISRRTLYNWKERYEPIREALSKGKDIYDNEAEEALHGLVTGYYVDEVRETISEFGDKQTVKSHKYIKPEITALIFWLQNRQPDRWRDKRIQTAADNSDKSSGVVILPEIDD